MPPALNPAEWAALAAARDRLLSAPHGAKAEVVAQAAATLGCSVPTLYRRLEQAGLHTGRKTRTDAGDSAMTEAELRLVSGVLYASRRDNAKQLLSIEDALDMLGASGQLHTRLSPGRVGALLRVHHLHPDQLAQLTPAQSLRSEHPNHVWQIDSSTCVLYYMKSGHLAAMDADEFYMNKPANLARVLSDLCTRYEAVDHNSSAFKVRYFLGGERAETIAEFLVWAVSRQDGVPMHGVPRILMVDKGPGNTSQLFQNLCRNLRIELIHHATGNARAVGAVEKTGDLVERHFEGRFRFFDQADLTLERINELACEWAVHYCAQRKHSRHRHTRYGAWMRITPEQLRVPASLELLRELVTSAPEERRVSNLRTITFAVKGFGKRMYDLSGIAAAAPAAKVVVCVNAYRAPAIDVQVTDPDTGEQHWQTVAPVETDEAGFDITAPVIGEKMRTAAHTAQDEQRSRVLREAYRAPGSTAASALPTLEEAERARKRHAQAYAGMVDAMADVRATPVPAYLPRRGTEHATPARQVLPKVLDRITVQRRLRSVLGESAGPAIRDYLLANFPDGATEADIEQIVELLQGENHSDRRYANGGNA